MENEIVHYLKGRVFPLSAVPYPKERMQSCIQRHIVRAKKGVTVRRRFFRLFYTCHRCCNTDPQKFATYTCNVTNETYTYCRNCIMFGRVSTKTTLVTVPNDTLQPKRDIPSWTGTYASSQQRAAVQFERAATKRTPHLLYAVCGAGKTEVMFTPIRASLEKGETIAVVSPRTDVIRELAPRFKDVFSSIEIQVLHGGIQPKPLTAPLVLATTHQMYRYERAFDAIYVDEADAFPFSTDETLRRATEKAAKKGAPIHFITATATNEMKRQYASIGHVTTIARRYHGYDLPVPTFRRAFGYARDIRKRKLHRAITHWVERQMERQKPYLLFCPSIEQMEALLPLVQRIDPNVRAVSSETPTRKEDVLALRNGKVQGLLTTTILERGITIPSLQVAVIGAEQPIFTKEALIQIGGRVGRSADDPVGDFVLFHHGVTFAMDAAKREIIRLNEVESV